MVVTIGLWKIVLAIVSVSIFSFYMGYEHRVLREMNEDEED